VVTAPFNASPQYKQLTRFGGFGRRQAAQLINSAAVNARGFAELGWLSEPDLVTLTANYTLQVGASGCQLDHRHFRAAS